MYFWTLINIGFILLVILQPKQRSITAKVGVCDIGPSAFGTLKGNCQDKGITSIPPDLDANIEVLDISFNNISTLNKDDLKNYLMLQRLIMRNLPVTSFPEGFFEHTLKITMVNISETQISNLEMIPISVNVLNFTVCKFETINLSHLVNLEHLYMRDSNPLKKVPYIAELAPLKILDLRYSDMTEANYTQIAPFCQLHFFGLYSDKLLEEKHMVRCCELRKWGLTWNMSGFKNQNCCRTEQYPFCRDLGITFSENAMNLHRSCLYRLRFSRLILFVVFITVFIIVITTLTTVTFFYFRYIHHRQRKEDEENPPVAEAEAEPEYDENSIV